MEKQLSCKTMGKECDFVVRDESEEEILNRFAEHAQSAHNLTFTKELRDKAKSMIREAA